MTNESRTIWFMRKGASLQCKWQIFSHRFCWQQGKNKQLS